METQDKQKSRWLRLIWIIFPVVIGSCILVLVLSREPVVETVGKTITQPVRSEQILTDWVYSRSNRISRGTCKLIVQESMKTPKPLITLAIMDTESNFVPSATSAKNAIGLMQINPFVWEKELITKGVIKERRDLYDIEPNIRVGAYIFHVMMTQNKGDVEKALEGYLGGRDGAYVKRILATLAHLYMITETRLSYDTNNSTVGAQS